MCCKRIISTALSIIGKAQKQPFFIFYDSRSGSTLLARLLVDELGVIIPPESRFLPPLLALGSGNSKSITVEQFLSVLSEDWKFQDWNIDLGELEHYLAETKINCNKRELLNGLIRFYIQKAGIAQANLAYFGFKKGNYQYHTSEISTIYPQSHFICLVRDGRAVFNSKKTSLYSETGLPFETDPTQAAKEWVRCLQSFEYILSHYKSRSALVHYEDLIMNPDNTIDQLADFLEIPRLRGKHQKAQYQVPTRYGELHKNVYEKPMDDRVKAWKQELLPAEIRDYESIAGEFLLKYGYDLVTDTMSRSTVFDHDSSP